MKEFIEKLIGRLEEQQAEAENEMHRLRSGDYTLPCSYDITDIKEIASESFKESIQIVNELAEEYKLLENIEQLNNGWMPCSRELPPQPKENPLFEYKPLELYLVSLSSTDYPWRAFWNGKYFTDGFSKVEPIAWMPLPAPYKEGVTENE